MQELIDVRTFAWLNILFLLLTFPLQQCSRRGKQRRVLSQYRRSLQTQHLPGTVAADRDAIEINLNPGYIRSAPVMILLDQGKRGLYAAEQAGFLFVTFCGKDRKQTPVRCYSFTDKEAMEIIGIASKARENCDSLATCSSWMELSSPGLIN